MREIDVVGRLISTGSPEGAGAGVTPLGYSILSADFGQTQLQDASTQSLPNRSKREVVMRAHAGRYERNRYNLEWPIVFHAGGAEVAIKVIAIAPLQGEPFCSWLG
jgi:hypothetical protein